MVADYKILTLVSALALLNHLANLLAPAWGMAALLAAALTWRGAGGGGALRRFGVHLAWLGVAGSGVLVAGLVLQGRDGRMATYAALVLVLGALAAWRDRPSAR